MIKASLPYNAQITPWLKVDAPAGLEIDIRTDNFNFRSQRAILALGAKLDGVLRHQMARRDGTVRDSHLYSILRSEWRDVKRHLELRLARWG